MADPLKQPYLRKVDKRGDIQVWIFDGSYVRGHIDEEFTNFGQHYRYAYIPENEFWIDIADAEDIVKRDMREARPTNPRCGLLPPVI